MKKIFVVTDNLYIFKTFSNLFKERDICVDFYCSPKSRVIFKTEIDEGQIKEIILKETCAFLIDNYELGFSCHSKQIFPAKLVGAVLCVNIHPGLNPYNRGWFPQVFSIINKKPAGATIHVMDEEIDHGDIIAQESVEILSSDTSGTAYKKIQERELELFSKNLESIINASFSRKKPSCEGNYNSIQDFKSLCRIDLEKTVSMREAIDFLRAMTHPPYKNAYFIDENGKKIFISIELEERPDI